MAWCTTVGLFVVCFVVVTKCDNKIRIVNSAPQGPVTPFGPGDNLADMYCAYCRQRGWWACIQRWCFRSRVTIARDVIARARYLGYLANRGRATPMRNMNQWQYRPLNNMNMKFKI